MIDLPPNIQFLTSQPRGKIVVVQYVAIHDTMSLDKIAMGPSKESSGQRSHADAKQHGICKLDKDTVDFALPIVSMNLPPVHWKFENQPMGEPSSFCLNFTNDKHKLKISLSGSNHQNPIDSGSPKISTEQPSELTNSELPKLYDETFKSAHYEVWNGKRVLVLRGHYSPENVDIFRIEFGQGPNAASISASYMLTFQAPPAEYRKNLSSVLAAFKTIEWNKQLEVEN